MINNLLDILSYENIYLIANWGVIPFWLLLIILPYHGVTNFFAQSIIAQLLLAIAYGLVVFDIFIGVSPAAAVLGNNLITKPVSFWIKGDSIYNLTLSLNTSEVIHHFYLLT